jgi:hypothetical protein
MAGRRLGALALTEAEKSELTALAARPKTAQALAGRARIVLAIAVQAAIGLGCAIPALPADRRSSSRRTSPADQVATARSPISIGSRK